MIRWCSYCQRFLGEKAPYDDPAFSHGVCDDCDARLERGEPIHSETQPLRALVQRLIESASVGDELACDALLAEASASPLSTESLLIGVLQPALYQAGLDWQAARMSVAAEHRLTSWCERAFSALPAAARPLPLDMAIFQAPGNSHTLGPRFAARVLAARGLSVEAVVPALPVAEIVALVRDLRPRAIGLSCALPAAATAAMDLVTSLREALEPELRCRYFLSGMALRTGAWTSDPSTLRGVEVVTELDGLARELRASAPVRA